MQALEQDIDRKILQPGTDDSRLELIDVEQLVQHARHHIHQLADPRDQLQRIGVFYLGGEDSLQQGDGLQRLTQVMARGGEEARFAEIGPLGLLFRGFDRRFGMFAIGDVVDGQQGSAFLRRHGRNLAGIQLENAPASRR